MLFVIMHETLSISIGINISKLIIFFIAMNEIGIEHSQDLRLLIKALELDPAFELRPAQKKNIKQFISAKSKLPITPTNSQR